jgi:hypothetical protein
MPASVSSPVPGVATMRSHRRRVRQIEVGDQLDLDVALEVSR